jgi:hypothetical protein
MTRENTTKLIKSAYKDLRTHISQKVSDDTARIFSKVEKLYKTQREMIKNYKEIN